MDALLLSRIQFGFTISFHIIFPTLTIGLAWFLVAFEAAYRRSGKTFWLDLYLLWVKIFALTFGMGVVSGLVLSYEFGTNFSRLSEMAGPVLGPLLSAEVLTAFFVEAGFLGVMLFGWKKVGPRLHFMASLLVAVGTTNSAFWIISANSWMHTPQGVEWVNGQLVPVDWFAVVFNPSFPYRLVHMLMAAFLSASLLVGGVSAGYLLHGRKEPFARAGLRAALLTLAILAPLQIVVGDQHGLEVQRMQPMKVAAMEGLWRTESSVPLVAFAIPDQAAQTNRYAIEIPRFASLILTHSLDGEIKGLNEVPVADQPPVWPVFWGFRLMVGLGLWFLLLGFSGVLLWRLGHLESHRLYLRLLNLSAPLGVVATITGWIVAETGRQPWVVYGLIRTRDAVSPISAAVVASSLVLFVIVYGVLFSAWLYFIFRILQRGPMPPDPQHPEAIRGARPATVIPPDHAPEAN
jgi:cytochrome d ubiquinol oxidase subunit I